MAVHDKLPIPEPSSFTSPLVATVIQLPQAHFRRSLRHNDSELRCGRELSAVLRWILEQHVPDGGMHWNGVGVAESCSIGPADEELTPTGGAVTRRKAIGEFLGRVRAPAVSFVTVDSTASRKRPSAIFKRSPPVACLHQPRLADNYTVD
jgi:hypothetical protein